MFLYFWKQERKQSILTEKQDLEMEDAIKDFQDDKYNKSKKKKENNS